VVRVDPHWTYHGLPLVRLENRWCAIDVLARTGGKILRVIDKTADRNVLWENPRIVPHEAPVAASFDDHWAGGWDDAFPGGAPSTDRYGEATPYMGELWTARWDWRVVDRNGPELELSVQTPITPARYTRTLRLRDDAPVLDIGYRIEHVGTQPFDFMWGIHPALSISPAHRFDVPATHAEVDEWAGGGLGRAGDSYEWPNLPRADGSTLDVRRAQAPDFGSLALHYLSGLQSGWVACTDTSIHRGFGLVFDPSTFPVVWLWMVYGAWRGYYHAALELWTSYPGRLAEAVAAGRAPVLGPGEVRETRVSAVLYGGVDEVTGLRADGSVSGRLAAASPAS
jgi:hypothetical protein